MKVFYLLILFFTPNNGATVYGLGPFDSVKACEADMAKVTKELDRFKSPTAYGLSCVEMSPANKVRL
jgi:hypothetical protein